MSGPPRVRSMNVAAGDTEARPVLVPAGNKARAAVDGRKPAKKLVPETESREKNTTPATAAHSPAAILNLRQDRHQAVLKNLSMNASCSSDASSTDSSTHSGASSSGKAVRRVGVAARRKPSGVKAEKVEKASNCGVAGPDIVVEVDLSDSLESKKRCAWITPNTEPCYVAFHDEEWGVPVHDDKKLFELLSFSGALAELAWPTILTKRNLFREVFMDFDPSAVSKLNEKRLVAPGSTASSLLSELRLRSIIENARQMCKIIEEFGSFDTFIWNYVNHKHMVSQFRYPRQVPVKSPKAEVISKELVRRGFRTVGPTVIYTFMQVAGLTNDHLISCFRFKECTSNAETVCKESSLNSKVKEKPNEEPTEDGVLLAVNKLSFTSK